MHNLFKNKTILVTGGTGSFGKKFIKKLLLNYKVKKIIIFSRDETKQVEMENNFIKFTKSLRFFIGDIRDLQRLNLAMSGVDIVVHAAALKHVPVSEYNPFETIKTNILGSQNLIEASLNSNVKKVIALSTDKAAAPINLYGASKLASDKLFIAANNIKGKRDIKFSVVRYGNVFGSRGSVVPFFLKQKKNSYIPITHKDMTRFNITLDQGVDFVLKCIKRMWGGEIFVPKIPSYNLLDVAKAIAPNSKIKIIGIRPGEKIHEEMITETDSLNAVEFKDYFVILPNSQHTTWKKKDFIKKSSSSIGKVCKFGFSYNSKNNKEFMSINDIKKCIVKILK